MKQLPKPARSGPKPRKRIVSKGKAGSRTSRRRKARKAKLKDADRLFSEYIRTRDDWQCKACGSPKRPQCAHLISRRYRAVRWNPGNAVCLCSACHVRFTHDPLGWEAWCEERFPGTFTELKRIARLGIAHVDYEYECDGIRALLALLRARRTA